MYHARIVLEVHRLKHNVEKAFNLDSLSCVPGMESVKQEIRRLYYVP